MNRYQIQFERTTISYYEVNANSEKEAEAQLWELGLDYPLNVVDLDPEFKIELIETDS